MSIRLLVRARSSTGATVSSGTSVLTAPDTGWHTISTPYAAKGTGNTIAYSLYATNFASSSQSLTVDCLSLQALTS